MKKKIAIAFMSIGMLLVLSVVVGAFLDVCLANSLPNRKCTEKKCFVKVLKFRPFARVQVAWTGKCGITRG